MNINFPLNFNYPIFQAEEKKCEKKEKITKQKQSNKIP